MAQKPLRRALTAALQRTSDKSPNSLITKWAVEAMVKFF